MCRCGHTPRLGHRAGTGSFCADRLGVGAQGAVLVVNLKKRFYRQPEVLRDFTFIQSDRAAT